MNRYRIKNIYLVISFFLVFVIMFVSLLIDFPRFIETIIFRELPIEYPVYEEYLIKVMNFERFIAASKVMLQLTLPIIAIIPTFHFREEVYHFFNYAFGRIKNYKRTVLSSLLINAFIISTSIYIAYILCLFFASLVFPIGNDSNYLYNVLFDVIGDNLFLNHRVIYFCIVGIIEVWLTTFVYSLFSLTLILKFNKSYIPYIYPYLFYAFLSLLIPIIANFVNMPYLNYLSPSLLANPNIYSEPTTLYILMGYLPLLIAFIIYIYKTLNNKERIFLEE